MLTNVAIKAFKPAAKPYKKSDGGGLFLLIQPNGSKTWRFAYRFNGKQQLLSGGPYPATTLLAARSWRDMMKHQLAARRRALRPVLNGLLLRHRFRRSRNLLAMSNES